jgi:hypothetical protein
MRVSTPLGRLLLRVAISTTFGLAAFPLFVTAFHPYDGLVAGYRESTSLERWLALVLALIVFAAIYAQMQRRRWPTIGPGVDNDVPV